MSSPATNWSPQARNSAALEIYLLGCVEYDAALYLQERLVREISDRNDRMGALLVCEHPPMVTIGRDGSSSQILAEQRTLDSYQMGTRWINRGGGSLVHSPGQLAAYPIVPLKRLGLSLVDVRNQLVAAAVDTCSDHRIVATPLEHSLGISSRLGQLAWLGLAAKWWTTYHGLFLNVATDPAFARMVRMSPPGSRVTSMAAQASRPIAMHSVRANLVHHITERLGYTEHHIYAGHPLLRRVKRKIRVHA